jgi:peptidoglycan/LPS O-acetylase OafA/YrhL
LTNSKAMSTAPQVLSQSAISKHAAGLRNDTTHFFITDALRAFAILLVVAYHLVWHAKPMVSGHVLTLAYLGVWGVNCFFVLTGFLLGPPFIRALLNGCLPVPSIKQFLIRRFFRIYPLYFVAVVFSSFVVAFYSGVVPSLMDVASHLSLVQSYSTLTVFSINSPLWTMGIDATFYLFLPIMTIAARPLMNRLSASGRVRAVYLALCVIILGSIVFRYIQYSLHPDAVSDYAASTVFARNVVGMSSAFAFGILVAMLTATRSRVPRLVYAAIAIIGAASAVLELLLHLEVNSSLSRTAFLRMTLVDPLAALSSAMILYALVEARFTYVSKLVESRVVKIAATLSYAIYLFHMPIISAIRNAFFGHAVGMSVYVGLTLVSVPIVLGVAFFMNLYVERPFLLLKNRHQDLR